MKKTSIYAVSDIHSCFTKFKSAIPSGANHIYVLGDMFNKCTEQQETLWWWLEHCNNSSKGPIKFSFLWGNHEFRFYHEIVRYMKSLKPPVVFKNSPKLMSIPKPTWNLKESNINITNVTIQLIESGALKLDALKIAFESLHWYSVHKSMMSGTTYILSHASWDISNPSAQSQDPLNLIYDNVNLRNQVGSKTLPTLVEKYCKMCNLHKVKHIIGHHPTPKVFKTPAPYVVGDALYFIDNHTYSRSTSMYFHPLE